MGAAVRYAIPGMADLARQLRFAPPRTVTRQIAHAVELAGDLDPTRPYPMAFVVYRLTQFRMEHGEDVSVAGAALQGDLALFALEASKRAPRRANESTGRVVALAEVAQRLGVSDRTLRRWRRLGLVIEWIDAGGAAPVLGVFESVLERVQRAHAGALDRARAFRRLSPRQRKQVVEEIRARMAAGSSSTAAKHAVAGEFGISDESARLIWQQYGAKRPAHRAHSDAWFARVQRRGIALATAAQRAGCTTAAATRAALAGRATALANLLPSTAPLPAFLERDADNALLGASWVNGALIPQAPLDALGMDHPSDAVPLGHDLDLLMALRYLVWRAHRGATTPTSRGAIDNAERDARWAAALLRTLVAWHTPSLLRGVGVSLGVPVQSLPADPLRRIVLIAQRALASTAMSADVGSMRPARTRLDRIAQLPFEQRISREPALHLQGRAHAVHGGSVALVDAVGAAHPWVRGWEAGCGIAPGARAAGGGVCRDLDRLFGWSGQRPMSVSELACHWQVSSTQAASRLTAALRASRKLWSASLLSLTHR